MRSTDQHARLHRAADILRRQSLTRSQLAYRFGISVQSVDKMLRTIETHWRVVKDVDDGQTRYRIGQERTA